MKPPTQCDRLLLWLRENPGSSSLEITWALHLVNVTGRISDLRKKGHNIVCQRDKAGIGRYILIEQDQMPLGLELDMDDPKASQVVTAFVGIGGLAVLFAVSGMIG